MPCSACNSQLLVGKEHDDSALWCPNCEGIEILPEEDLLCLLVKNLKGCISERKLILDNYSKESILGSLCATLESESAMSASGPLRGELICYLSYAIRDVESSEFEGEFEIHPYSPEFQMLLQFYKEIFSLRFILPSLVKDKYAIGIVIPEKDMMKYSAVTADYFENIDLDHDKPDAVYIKFTEEWQFNKLVASRFGIVSELDARRDITGPDLGYRKRNDPIEKLDVLKHGFQFSAGTSNVLRDISKNLDLEDLLVGLYKEFNKSFSPEEQSFDHTSGTIFPIKEKEFLEALSTLCPDVKESVGRIKRIYIPLLIKLRPTQLLFLPNTALIYVHLLRSERLQSMINKQREQWGGFFERVAYSSLTNFRYKVTNPNDNQPLINIRITDGTIAREIDVAGFKEDHSVIIECKHFEIGSNFFKRKEIEKRKKKIIKELEKFTERMEVLKNDEKYQFLWKDKRVVPIFLTLHPEPISHLGDIKVVDFRDLIKELGDLGAEVEEGSELHMKITPKLSVRPYGKTALIGIDYTRSIEEPFGMKGITIPALDTNKSDILVGDGKVLRLDEKELFIESVEEFDCIVDLTEEDVKYLREENITEGNKIRFQIYTKDPIFASYYLRFIIKMD